MSFLRKCAMFGSDFVTIHSSYYGASLDRLQPCAEQDIPLIPVLFVYVTIVVQPQSLSSGCVDMTSWYFLWSTGFGQFGALHAAEPADARCAACR